MAVIIDRPVLHAAIHALKGDSYRRKGRGVMARPPAAGVTED